MEGGEVLRYVLNKKKTRTVSLSDQIFKGGVRFRNCLNKIYGH